MVSKVKIEVDVDRCVGAGMCALTAPAVFTQDDDGFSRSLGMVTLLTCGFR